MSLKSWISSVFQPRRRPIRNAVRRKYRLNLEQMQDRVVPSTTWFVKGNAAGANNGTSWANAYTNLHTALGVATAGDQVWVAKGTYSAATTAGGPFLSPRTSKSMAALPATRPLSRPDL